jgi:2-oxoglutarate ferredoxin oxidoreductase subunit beta
MGQFVHVIRRNLKMVYLVMNNGCYGLTKGQDSATADAGSKNKHGSVNLFESIDLASLAIELGATFVAQSFSGDKEQLIPILKAAMSHSGFAFINVISPCVTFNNNPGSTKAYDYVREHMETTALLDFVPIANEIKANYEEGSVEDLRMHDGSVIKLHKIDNDWDPLDRISAINAVQKSRVKGEILTGLLYVNSDTSDLHEILSTSEKPLNALGQDELCPGSDTLKKINDGLR